ncbi:unnamed protein product [Closterium sp. NIES-65]|nr:unnamed protein product [Closterium sp. NIES-65]
MGSLRPASRVRRMAEGNVVLEARVGFARELLQVGQLTTWSGDVAVSAGVNRGRGVGTGCRGDPVGGLSSERIAWDEGRRRLTSPARGGVSAKIEVVSHRIGAGPRAGTGVRSWGGGTWRRRGLGRGGCLIPTAGDLLRHGLNGGRRHPRLAGELLRRCIASKSEMPALTSSGGVVDMEGVGGMGGGVGGGLPWAHPSTRRPSLPVAIAGRRHLGGGHSTGGAEWGSGKLCVGGDGCPTGPLVGNPAGRGGLEVGVEGLGQCGALAGGSRLPGGGGCGEGSLLGGLLGAVRRLGWRWGRRGGLAMEQRGGRGARLRSRRPGPWLPPWTLPGPEGGGGEVVLLGVGGLEDGSAHPGRDPTPLSFPSPSPMSPEPTPPAARFTASPVCKSLPGPAGPASHGPCRPFPCSPCRPFPVQPLLAPSLAASAALSSAASAAPSPTTPIAPSRAAFAAPSSAASAAPSHTNSLTPSRAVSAASSPLALPSPASMCLGGAGRIKCFHK